MKMKKQTAIKILAAMLTIFMVVSCMQVTVFADESYMDPNSIQPNDNANAASSFRSAAGSILGIVQIIAAATAVIMLIVLGIKYISAAPEGKAEIKKMATIYIIGAICLFGASGILGLIKQFAEGAFKAN